MRASDTIDPEKLRYFEDQLVWSLAGLDETRTRFAGHPVDVWKRLVDHVRHHVPAYRKLAWQGSVSATLATLPLVRREDVIESPRDYLDKCAGEYFVKKLSSGTSGSTFCVEFDRCAQTFVSNRLLDLLLIDLPKLIHLFAPGRIALAIARDSREFVAPPTILASHGLSLCYEFSVDRDTVNAALLQRLCAAAPAILHGHAVLLRWLADRLKQSRLVLRPACVLVAGERCYADDVQALKESFEAPLFCAYTCTEAGIVGLSRENDIQSVRVDKNFVVAEVLDSKGCLSGNGGGEIVLSSVFNWRNPLLRYATGDFGVLVSRPDGSQQISGIRRRGELSHLGPNHVPAEAVDRIFGSHGINDARLKIVGTCVYLILGDRERGFDLVRIGRELADLLGVHSVRIRVVQRAVGAASKRLRFPSESLRKLDQASGRRAGCSHDVGHTGW